MRQPTTPIPPTMPPMAHGSWLALVESLGVMGVVSVVIMPVEEVVLASVVKVKFVCAVALCRSVANKVNRLLPILLALPLNRCAFSSNCSQLGNGSSSAVLADNC